MGLDSEESCGCGGSGCGCGGNSCGGFERKVYSKEEKVEWMKGYLHDLEMEVKAVKEKLAMLEKK